MQRRPAGLATLQARIRAIELGGTKAPGTLVPFGVAAIDDALPGGGLVRGALHEITGETVIGGAATGFAAALAAHLATPARPLVLWCLGSNNLYAPGLPAFGLDPSRLLVVRARRPTKALWVAEESLRADCLAAVVCESDVADLVASRRLHLAARERDTACLLLTPANARGAATATTRWRVAPAPTQPSIGDTLGTTRWRLTLAHCRGGSAPRQWRLDWTHETGDFALATPLANRRRATALANLRRAG